MYLIEFETEFFIDRVFIGILGESFEIQFIAIFLIDCKHDFNHIWNPIFLLSLSLYIGFSLEY